MTMIGRKVVSAAFDLDFRRPRHSARKPPTEFAPPTSTPNSVRWTGSLGRDFAASCSASSVGGADATTSGIGAAVMTFAGLSGFSGLSDFSALSGFSIVGFSIVACFSGVAGFSGVTGFSGSISFVAAGSGGPIIDFAATRGGAGVTAGVVMVAGEATGVVAGKAAGVVALAGGFDVFWESDATVAGAGSGAAAATGAGLSTGFSAGFGAVVATGDKAGAGDGL